MLLDLPNPIIDAVWALFGASNDVATGQALLLTCKAAYESFGACISTISIDLTSNTNDPFSYYPSSAARFPKKLILRGECDEQVMRPRWQYRRFSKLRTIAFVETLSMEAPSLSDFGSRFEKISFAYLSRLEGASLNDIDYVCKNNPTAT